MENHQITPCIIVLTLLLTACVKDELYNTPHPDRGATQVSTHWTEISEDAVQPESYVFCLGESTYPVSGTNNTLNELLPEGTYTLLVHNLPHGVTVTPKTATVNTLPDGTLEPMPEYLFSAVQKFNIRKDDTLKVNILMKQSIRSLTLILKLDGGDETRIASTHATLTGVAYSIDLYTGRCDATATAKSVKPSFQLNTPSPTRAGKAPALIATVRLAGITTDVPKRLTLVVGLINGITQTFETDLTDALKDFAKEVNPLILDATLQLPGEGDMGGTINDWTVVENGNFPIH